MINANLNINGARKGLAFPTAGLQYNYSQSAEGEDLVDSRGNGVDIPFVSGTGLNQIFDFGVLGDNRFDKGSYVGNSFGLPEYYNFPYVDIYYNDATAATRKHWKITDFAYAVILAQSITLDNQFFLKALATTDTSNVIASWSGLYIYSTALSGNDLSKMKTYIGIQPDFEGDEMVLDSYNFLSGSVSVSGVTFTFEEIGSVNGFETGGIRLDATSNSSNPNTDFIRCGNNNFTYIGKFFNAKFRYRSSSDGIERERFFANSLTDLDKNTGNAKLVEINNRKGEQDFVLLYKYGPVSGGFVEFGDVSIKQFYQNYYKS